MWERLERREINRLRPPRASTTGDRPRPDRPAGTDLLPQIQHIVVLMMENHSYNNYFGLLTGRGEGLPPGPDGVPAAGQLSTERPGVSRPSVRFNHPGGKQPDADLARRGGRRPRLSDRERRRHGRGRDRVRLHARAASQPARCSIEPVESGSPRAAPLPNRTTPGSRGASGPRGTPGTGVPGAECPPGCAPLAAVLPLDAAPVARGAPGARRARAANRFEPATRCT